jgi:hypothetical protein
MRLQSVTSQETRAFIVTVVRTTNNACPNLFPASDVNTTVIFILCLRDPLLSKDRETKKETTAVAMQQRGKHASTTVGLPLKTVLWSQLDYNNGNGMFSMRSVLRKTIGPAQLVENRQPSSAVVS